MLVRRASPVTAELKHHESVGEEGLAGADHAAPTGVAREPFSLSEIAEANREGEAGGGGRVLRARNGSEVAAIGHPDSRFEVVQKCVGPAAVQGVIG